MICPPPCGSPGGDAEWIFGMLLGYVLAHLVLLGVDKFEVWRRGR